MMFLAPGFLFASLGAAAAIVALHFIVTRQPRAGILPTARFVPDMPASATARATRPSDLPLMLLRVLTVLLIGAALAKPVLKPSRSADARVILADVSRASRDSTTLRDSVRALYRAGDALILFDSSSRALESAQSESISAMRPSTRRGNLSAAIIAAMRAASRMRDRADSMELVIVSPFAKEEMDAATSNVRKLWPGKARLVNVPAPADTAGNAFSLEARSSNADPLQVTAAIAKNTPGANALISRADVGVDDPQVSAVAGRPFISWPAASRPKGAVTRAVTDTIEGVLGDNSLVVAEFARRWSYPPDSIRSGEIVARWIDGEPAAIEWPMGAGCERSVAVPVSTTGDLAIRDDFVRLVGELSGPCALKRAGTRVGPETLAMLAGTGGLASRDAFRPRADIRSTLAPYLLALALILAVAELFVRRRRTEARVASIRQSAREERAA